MAHTIIFPSLFFDKLKPLLRQNIDAAERETALTNAYNIVKPYDKQLWSSKILIIPVYHKDHWIIAVVANMDQALSRECVGPPAQSIAADEYKPDTDQFALFTINSLGETKHAIPATIRSFLEHHFHLIKGSELQFVDIWNAKVGLLHSRCRPRISLTITAATVPVSDRCD